ncbi:LysR family transcriptional regulator [Streptomyces tropicalis]|uniref:LysR family transcriptional regulator n=1 Tax=Streptomyces tropicalis TaxID=3034234 RepID=A0ABT6A948_9ACTN|nr:LysR family transcriptional regulator [Streptomyces tropicalis]MDF3300861.1 LysR family transcriptional regulator [Streptomyces tropicalis]
MSIELHHLRGFLALADEKHFTRAAKRMNVSQPTLSRNIRRLEELLGRRLLERTTRHVTLTPAGESLYDRLHVLLPQLEAALRPESDEDTSLSSSGGSTSMPSYRFSPFRTRRLSPSTSSIPRTVGTP